MEQMLQQIPSVIGEKLVVKPNDQGSTVGLSLSTQKDFDMHMLTLAQKMEDEIFLIQVGEELKSTRKKQTQQTP